MSACQAERLRYGIRCAYPVTPGFLRVIQRPVRFAQQRIDVMHGGLEGRYADRHSDVHQCGIRQRHQRIAERFAQPRCRIDRLPVVGFREQYGELLAADTAQQVLRTYRPLAHVREMLQDEIAGFVPPRIVDALEIVDIQDE